MIIYISNTPTHVVPNVTLEHQPQFGWYRTAISSADEHLHAKTRAANRLTILKLPIRSPRKEKQNHTAPTHLLYPAVTGFPSQSIIDISCIYDTTPTHLLYSVQNFHPKHHFDITYTLPTSPALSSVHTNLPAQQRSIT